MKEHPRYSEILSFFCVRAYTRRRDSKGVQPLGTQTLAESLVCYTSPEMYRLSVRTYAAIAPNASYRVTTKFAQSELDSAKQKAGYHYHSDTLPLLIFILVLSQQKIPGPNGLAASFLVDIPTRWKPRTNQSPARALIAFAALGTCCSSPVPSCFDVG